MIQPEDRGMRFGKSGKKDWIKCGKSKENRITCIMVDRQAVWGVL